MENEQYVTDVTNTLDAFHISDRQRPNVPSNPGVNPFDKAGLHCGNAGGGSGGNPQVPYREGSHEASPQKELSLEERRERRRQRAQARAASRERAERGGEEQRNAGGGEIHQTSRIERSEGNVGVGGEQGHQGQGQRQRRRYITRDEENADDGGSSGQMVTNSGPEGNLNASGRRMMAGDNLLPSRPVIPLERSNSMGRFEQSRASNAGLSQSQKWQQRQNQGSLNESYVSDQSPGNRSSDRSFSSNEGTPAVVRQRRARSVERMSQVNREGPPPQLSRMSPQLDRSRNTAENLATSPQMQQNRSIPTDQSRGQYNYTSCDNKQLSLPEQTEVTVQSTEASAGNVLAKLQSTYKLLRSRSFNRDKKPEVVNRDPRESSAVDNSPRDNSARNDTPVQQPTVQHPTMQHPTMQHPTLQHPMMQHPTMQHPTMQHPTEQFDQDKDPNLIYRSDQGQIVNTNSQNYDKMAYRNRPPSDAWSSPDKTPDHGNRDFHSPDRVRHGSGSNYPSQGEMQGSTRVRHGSGQNYPNQGELMEGTQAPIRAQHGSGQTYPNQREMQGPDRMQHGSGHGYPTQGGMVDGRQSSTRMQQGPGQNYPNQGQMQGQQRVRHGSGSNYPNQGEGMDTTQAPMVPVRTRHGSGSNYLTNIPSPEGRNDVRQYPSPNTSQYLEVFDADQSKLKRMTGVTDLDQAMRDRDQTILNKRFGSSPQQSQSADKRVPRPGTAGAQTYETDLDVDDSPAGRYRSPVKYPDRSPKTAGGSPMSPSGQHFFGNGDKSPASPKTFPPASPSHVSDDRDNRRPDNGRVRDHRPPVSLEDAVRWPFTSPGKLDFSNIQVFEGKMLLQWLQSSLDEKHYLRLVLTRHDLNVVTTQFCTCLLAAGVIVQVESKRPNDIFRTDCMYYWTHTQSQISKQNVDIGKLTPMWPPLPSDEDSSQIGQKYTEAEHQAVLLQVRTQYVEELEKVKEENQSILDKCREEYQNRLQECMERIAQLQNDVERFRKLAGIEEYTQEALAQAEAARMESHHYMNVNGFLTPQGERFLALTGTPQSLMSTPSHSQYHTPAVTPECVTGQYPMNALREDEDMTMPKPPDELRPDTAPPVPPPPPPPLPPRAPPPPPAPPIPGGAPPPPPPPPGLGGPPPPPPPPPGAPPAPGAPGAPGLSRRASMKPVIQTRSPMKPLFWQRIQVSSVKVPQNKQYVNAKLLWEELEEAQIDVEEVDSLFSKPVDVTKTAAKAKPKTPVKQVAKIIEPKRSQLVGILLSSLRLEFSEIEHAILTFDTSQLDGEKLQAIYDHRGDDDELKKIRKHVDQHPDIPLDKPDQFLYDLSTIPDFAERIYCFIFQNTFQESTSVIDNKLNNLRMTCEMLMKGDTVRHVLGLILAVGNYMNGGNRNRGQADGFGLDILPKLKDVKTKDNRMSLLHYVVSLYVKKFEKETAGTDHAKLPVPDPSDISQAALVSFDEIEKELKKIRKDFDSAEKRAEKVMKKASPQYLQPFKDIMTAFFSKGKTEYKEQEENLKEAKKLFLEVVIFFCIKPKSGEEEVTPEYFFSLWSVFCKDFKDIWKKEQQRMVKLRIKEAEVRLKQLQEKKRQAPSTRTRRAGGLKDKLANKGMLQ